MRDHPEAVGHQNTPLAAQVLTECRRLLTTRSGRWLLSITQLLGLLAAVGVVAGSPAADRTLAAVSTPVQSLMSVTAPFLGVLLTSKLHRARHRNSLRPALFAATALALVVAVSGVLLSVVAVAVAPSTAQAGTWQHFGLIVTGSIVVQVIAQLVGTGLGLLLRSPVVACIASIVLPLGLWLVLGSTDTLRPAQDWLTPFAGVARLTAGQLSALGWVQSLVVFLIWAVGLNAVGAARLRARRS